MIMTNWNLYTRKYAQHLAWYTIAKLIRSSKLDLKDIFVPWGDLKILRYYHCFTKRELRGQVRKIGFEVLEEYRGNEYRTKEKNSNLVIVAEK